MAIRIEKQTNTVAILRCQIPISDKEYIEFRRIKKQNERSAKLWLRKQIFKNAVDELYEEMALVQEALSSKKDIGKEIERLQKVQKATKV